MTTAIPMKIIWVDGQPVRVPSTLHLRQPRQSSLHSCTFCDWRGLTEFYYGHWRTQHRTRAGVQRADIKQSQRNA